jgi:Na+/phosphate symporter
MSELGQQLIDRVTKIEDAGDAIIAILEATRTDLAEAIANNSIPEAQEVLDRLASQTDELAAAAVANTPAA